MLKKSKIKGKNEVKVTFVLPEDHPNIPASVVGDFNDWNPSANKLIKRSNQTYSTAVKLRKGQTYSFRYRSRDGIWFNDDAPDGFEANEHGSQNCILNT